MMNRHCTSFCFVLLIVLGFLPSSLVAENPLTQPLAPEEVACNERQLERLLLRMNSTKEIYRTPQLPNYLLVSYSNSVGFYEGLVATNQFFRLGPGEVPPVTPFEHYLAFNINPSIRTLRLNPASPELPQVNLSREESGSNLVARGSYFELTLTLQPTLGGGEPLVINNFSTPAIGKPYNGFLANSTKPGRGLIVDQLLAPCHGRFTDFDRHVFAVLQRMVRAVVTNAPLLADIEVSIFRGVDPHTYRINVYPIFESLDARGKIAVELEISWTSTGQITAAEMRILPDCAVSSETGCTALRVASPIVFLIPPILGGAEQYPNDATENGVFYVWDQGASAPKTIDLGALLAHTTWNRPIW